MNKLWSIDEIGRYVSYADRQVRKLVSQPDFPSPVRLFNGAHPRWIEAEVREYCEARKGEG